MKKSSFFVHLCICVRVNGQKNVSIIRISENLAKSYTRLKVPSSFLLILAHAEKARLPSTVKG